jgi:transposase
VEDLNLKSLAKTKQAKSWLDASFGELFRQIAYKSLWNGKHFVPVDRFCVVATVFRMWIQA